MIFRALTLIAFLAASIHAQAAFEVASIRVTRPEPGADSPYASDKTVTPGALALHGHNLRGLIEWAYQVHAYQISGPALLTAERFEVTAKAGGAATEDEMRPMMRALLAERFKLAMHREKKEMRVLALVPAKAGAGLKESREAAASIEHLRPGVRMVFRRQPVSALVDFLATLPAVKRPVVDRSGLTKLYDFDIDLTDAVQPNINGISVSTVLQAQLGLKLSAIKGAADIWVIDHVEKLPLDN